MSYDCTGRLSNAWNGVGDDTDHSNDGATVTSCPIPA